MRRVLVTGATGFLGRHVVDACRAQAAGVIGTIRAERAVPATDGVRYVVSPGSDVDGWRALLEGVDVIYHLAVRRAAAGAEALRACFETNVVLTDTLLQAAVGAGTRRFVFFGAGNAYAPEGDAPAPEQDPLYPVETAPAYLGSKVVAEVLVEHYRRSRDLAAVSLRISSPYGAGMPEGSVVAAFVRQARAGAPIRVQGGGGYRADLVYAQDVVDLAIAAADSGAPGVYNVGAGVATTMAELARAVDDVYGGAGVEIEPATGRTARGFRPLDVAKAARTWSWTPTPLRAGLERLKVQR